MRSLVILAAVAALMSSVLCGCGKRDVVGAANKPSADARSVSSEGATVCPAVPGDCSVEENRAGGQKSRNEMFMEAVGEDDVATVTAMLGESKSFLAVRNVRKATPLHKAAKMGAAKCAEAMIKNGAELDAKNATGRTPLHAAATFNHLAIVKALLDRGANVNARGDNLGTPLHDAVVKGNLDTVRLLVEKGADVNAASAKGTTPLMIALTRDRKEIARLLIDKGATFDPKKLEAAMSGDPKATEELPEEVFCGE